MERKRESRQNKGECFYVGRKLFCEISPLTYQLSTWKEIGLRRIRNLRLHGRFAVQKQQEQLPVRVYSHKSLICRRLGNVDMRLQENKAINLAIAAPKINGILIRPGEIFSFWELVGRPDRAHGYQEGLVIVSGKPGQGIGGGMCQFTNLIHWMVLHSDLTIVEHHHHDNVDLFPDFGRVIPFGTGTSILYNYLDYRFVNHTKDTYQLFVHVSGGYLCGELRCSRRPPHTYHIQCRGEYFSREEDGVYRNNEIYRITIDNKTGRQIREELLRKNHAKIAYDPAGLAVMDRTAAFAPEN